MSLSLDDALLRLTSSDLPNELYGVTTPSPKSRATVEKVLEEAETVLAEDGVSGLSFRALARRCDMRLSNLQYYFSTQEDLLTAVTRYVLAQRLTELKERGPLGLVEVPQRFTAYLEFRMDRALDPRARSITTGLKDLAQREDGPALHFAETCRFHIDALKEMISLLTPKTAPEVVTYKAVMISGLVDSLGPTCGKLLDAPEGLRNAILAQARSMVGIA
ncbi:TetR family transcriptional regulator [Celeribacter sp. ULVN23_4]